MGMIFTNVDGQPLATGTAIDLLPYSPDAGIVGYAPTGEQIIVHHSCSDRALVLSSPEDFNADRMPVRIAVCVLSANVGETIWRKAIEEIESSTYPLYEYDLIARVYVGQNFDSNFNGLGFLGGFCSIGHLMPLPKFSKPRTPRLRRSRKIELLRS